MRADTGTLAIPPMFPSVPYVEAPNDDDAEPAHTLRLREAPTTSVPTPPAGPSPAPGEALTAERTERLLAQLPPLPTPDTTHFRFPVASPPLPRTGRVVLTSFPSPDSVTPPVRAAGTALQVVRVVPTGDIDLPPHITLTFSDAMVPLTTARTEEHAPPARLTPQPPGQWIWLDTRTLRFEPDDRFPPATVFAIEVPAGTRSATGAVLAQTVRAELTTPGPRAVGAYPALHPDSYGPRGRRPERWQRRQEVHARSVPHHPVVLVAFDQHIDAAAVLARARLTVEGRRLALRLAHEDEIAADSMVHLLTDELQAGEWVAFRPVAPLPPDADVRLTLDAGLPSLDGPVTTAQPQELRFHTYGPLRIASHSCNDTTCAPGQPWTILLTNPIDSASWSPDLVRVEPAPDDMSVHMFEATVQINAAWRAGTQYVAAMSPSIQDRFGQRLEEPRSLTADFQALPVLAIAGAPHIVLHPDSPPHVLLRTRGHRELQVRIHRVSVDDFPAWGLALRELQSDDRLNPPGELVASMIVEPGADGPDLTETVIDVGPALSDELGHAIVTVEAIDTIGAPRRDPRNPRWTFAWIQSTRIGLSASIDAEDIFLWASSLASGEPLGGVDLRMLSAYVPPGSTRETVSTAADGTAALPLGSRFDLAVIATRGADAALLPSNPFASPWYAPVWRRRPAGVLRWHMMTDRGLYQPGERVQFKGMLRHMQSRGAGLRVDENADSVVFTMHGPRREQLASDTLTTDALGAFSIGIQLPEALNLGRAHIRLHASGSLIGPLYMTHGVQIEEFRRPEYEVSVDADPGPYIIGDTIDAAVSAAYYGGGGLGGAVIEWRIDTRPGEYTPPGWDAWHFGGQPWLRSGEAGHHALSGVTDESGAHRVLIDLLSLESPFPTALRASAQVHDLTRQIGSGLVDLLVHPAALNVGMRMSRRWLHRGRTGALDVIVVDHDGRAIAGRSVDVVLERMHGDSGNARVVCRITSGAAAERCELTIDSPGLHRVQADVRDDAGRVSRTELTVWVAGEPGVPNDRLEPGRFEATPDRDEYQPGDTAHILIQAPFHPAEARVTIRNVGVMDTERLRIDTPSYELLLPITESHMPGIRVRVELVDAVGGVGYATGEADLSVPPHRRALDVRVAAQDTLATPGSEVTIDVEVRDPADRPAAGADVTLWMVDEAILALGDYTLSDPLDALYQPEYAGVLDDHNRRWIVDPADARIGAVMDELQRAGIGSQAVALSTLVVTGEAGGMDGQQQTELRTDFAPLAFYESSLRADAAGRVQFRARLPQSLTRYRIMAVAVAGAQYFGTGDAAVTVRSDLMVRVAAPRFLNYGDRFELPVLVQNATAHAMDVEVAARAAGVVIDGPGQMVTLAPGGRAEVRFDASAPAPGAGHVQVIAAGGGQSDAAGVVVPVYTPATVEAFATYGTIDSDDPVVLPLAQPDDVIEAFGGLEVSITATALHSLTDAVVYLCTYPFMGSEHIASRVIAVAALRDVLSAFSAAGLPSEKGLVAATQRDIAELGARQMWDGGWQFWSGSGDSHPFVSIHAAHALQRAHESGFHVPSHVLENAARYLTAMDSHVEEWPLNARQSAEAYALYVRHRMGDTAVVQPARALAAAPRDRVGGGLPLEAAGWLLHVLASDPASREQTDALHRMLLNRLVETAGTVTFAESYEDGEHLLLHSRRRTDAVVLEALIAAGGDDDVVIRLARSLLAHRARGRWSGTQENSWVLLALNGYFRTYEATTPAFDSRVWLDDRFAGGHAFQGRTTERQHIDVPMPQLLDADPDELVIARTGAGRMYYRAAVRYAPADLRTPSIDRGFHVSRVYEAVDDSADVQRDKDGTWRVRAGARVRVRLTMVAPSRRFHAALIDPLPAGLEPLNPELSGTGFMDDPFDDERRGYRGWWARWFEHQNLRDDRAEAFASLLPAGVHEYSYLTRATIPGSFVVPPPRAEMMYQPETFGRGAGDTVVVQER